MYSVCSLCIGIAMLLFAMFMSARLGIFQETLYSTYGKHPREAMFYSVSGCMKYKIISYSKYYAHSARFTTTRIFTTCSRLVAKSSHFLCIRLVKNC